MEEELPHRTVREIEYELNPDKNTYEHTTYEAIVDWISGQEISAQDFEIHYIPLLTAFLAHLGRLIRSLSSKEKAD